MIYFQLKYPEKKEQKKNIKTTNAMFQLEKRNLFTEKTQNMQDKK